MTIGDVFREQAEMFDNMSEEARRKADQVKEIALNTEINPRTDFPKGLGGDKRDALIEKLGAATSNSARREAVETLWRECWSKTIDMWPPEPDIPAAFNLWWQANHAANLLKPLLEYLRQVETFEAARDSLRLAASAMDAMVASFATGQ